MEGFYGLSIRGGKGDMHTDVGLVFSLETPVDKRPATADSSRLDLAAGRGEMPDSQTRASRRGRVLHVD
jgi:hypothetical protein